MASLRQDEWKTAVEVEREYTLEMECAKATAQAHFFQSKRV